MKSSLRKLIVLSLAFMSLVSVVCGGPTAAEKQKIETLLARVAGLQEATFIRNGSDYDAKSAEKFLRAKWGRSEKEINTVEDFIAKAATGSSTSGKPYMIRFKDGREVKCGEFLKAELTKLDSGAAK